MNSGEVSLFIQGTLLEHKIPHLLDIQ